MNRLRTLWVWPLPAVLAWLASWGLFKTMLSLALEPTLALGAACALGVVCSLAGDRWWRRLFIAAGFPLSLAFSGALQLPAWAWLLPLLLLLLVYPLNAWRDAPLFPTPADALALLPQHAPLPEGAQVLDAGCGLGHGLQALHRAYPQAALHGVEWSWPLRLLCALRCPWASVRQGDMWATPWGGYDMVYLFQRPESMPRAWDKACSELRPGAWLVSLDFAVPDHTPVAHWTVADGGKSLWLYRAPFPTLAAPQTDRR
ncbi:class I SAM-dependent methyltransferase [Curvibacter sp. APW13]|uniref:class I SAM-dependent methyltransferase n=1 Tax=Curvibacter sp. APW13 TaxID=3077236 RepID=UPI0028DF4BE4|nr:class I SAM-dependent methyltransferase [Curvibacter sp. APW13]MDT8990323.1 class I SAM-dependent methyltransferase [Curvibacter sp. APW13]